MSDVKWIKLSVSMFDDEKIRLIESMPEADTILICWVKLLSLAGKTNANGFIFLSENIPYTDEMLATVFNRPLNTVRMALEVFRKFEMIDMDERDRISITNWSKHQSVERLEQIREDGRRRVAEHRARKKAELPKPDCNVTGNGDVTDIEEDKEEELEEEIDKEDIKKNSPADNPQDPIHNYSSNPSISSPEEKDSKNNEIPYKEIVDYLNQEAGTQYRHTSKKTQALINARWKEGFRLDAFKRVIDNKVAEWLHNPEMNIYLRPETLFGTKFESYFNARPIRKGGEPSARNQRTEEFFAKYDFSQRT